MTALIRRLLGFELRPVIYCSGCGWWHEEGACG